jgi:hypothetical protein
MLNPSTADERTDDATIARCARRARRWGYGGLVVTNLFAFCTSDPARLRRARDPIGPENDAAIADAALGAAIVVCAWGVGGTLRRRAEAVRSLLARLGIDPYCLAWTRSGEPAHPLYLGSDRAPVRIEEFPARITSIRRSAGDVH